MKNKDELMNRQNTEFGWFELEKTIVRNKKDYKYSKQRISKEALVAILI